MTIAKQVPESEDIKAPSTVHIYVCPGCGNWYGSSSSRPLEEQVNRRTSMRNLADEDPKEWHKVTGTRVICQTCMARDGKQVERVLIEYVPKDSIMKAVARQLENRFREEEKSSGVALKRPNA